MAAPVDLIVAGNAIIIAIVVVVVLISCDVAAEGGVDRAVPPLSLSLLTAATAALYLIVPLNVRC